MPISPNSFSITAILRPCFSRRIWFSSVVLPAPRKPVSTVTGIFWTSLWVVWMWVMTRLR